MAQNPPPAVTYPDLGLTIQIFEPFSNLAPEVRAISSSKSPPKPFFHDATRGLRLYEGDALELLRRAKSETFDLIFADPPYFLSNGGITCQNGQMVSVNKGDWDKAVTFEQIHAFNLQWLRECHRLLKPNGTIWVSGTAHNIFSVGFGLQTLGFKVLNDIAWQKTNPPPNLACRYFTHAHETIIWARKAPKSKHYFDYPAMKRDNGDKQMQSVWRLPAPSKWEKRLGKHPTQKPEILLDRIIRAVSKPGDLILDPFCGSGTTGVIAARTGRQFVGFEIDEDFLELARARVQAEILACVDDRAQERVEPLKGIAEVDREWALNRLFSLQHLCLVELAQQHNQQIFTERKVGNETISTINKGWAGLTIRKAIGLPIGNSREPKGRNWELKLVSLKRNDVTGEVKAKESMQITMFDAEHVLAYPFEESHLFGKIQRLILVARLQIDLHETTSPILCVKSADVSLDIPLVYERVRADYETVRAQLRDGLQPEQTLGALIQVRTKGTGHGSKTKAWYAKRAFVNLLLGIGK